MEKVIILDRDGVINYDSDNYIKSPDEWNPLPGSLEAIARLNQKGYRVGVATNQSGIGRKYYSVKTLDTIHNKLNQLLKECNGVIDELVYCPHLPEDHCECRKPQPGMLLDLAKRFGVSIQGIPFVGDSLTDLQAATQVGAVPILVKTGKGKLTLEAGHLPEGTQVFGSLSEFTDSLDKNNL